MTVLHHSKSVNIFNFLAMNRLVYHISMPIENPPLCISNDAFISFFDLLNTEQTEYIITGKLAAAYHGVMMASTDIDLWIGPGVVNQNKLMDMILPDASAESKTIKATVNSLGEHFKLNVHKDLNYFPASKFGWCYVKSENSIVSDVNIPVMSLDDLIVEKTASQKQEDKQILNALENID